MLKEIDERNVTNFSVLNGNSEIVNSSNNDISDSAWESEVITLLESDTIPLSHQVAGHSRTGILKHKKFGYVLKPLQNDSRGSREIGLYMKVYNNNYTTPNTTTINQTENGNGQKENILQKHNKLLRKYLPNYFGVAKILQSDSEEESGNPVWKYYVAMEDLVEGFAKPCIMDIKIGTQTWDPSASHKKIAHEQSKYLGTKGPLGLSLTGMQYFKVDDEQCIKMEQGYGKTLTESSLIETIATFFNGAYDSAIPKLIAKKLLPRLKEIQEYFEEQREFCFYSSSLLIGYDAERFDPNKRSQSQTCSTEDENIDSWLRLYMIDFCHVFPMMGDNPGPDTNYQFGLSNLIRIFRHIEEDSSIENNNSQLPQ